MYYLTSRTRPNLVSAYTHTDFVALVYWAYKRAAEKEKNWELAQKYREAVIAERMFGQRLLETIHALHPAHPEAVAFPIPSNVSVGKVQKNLRHPPEILDGSFGGIAEAEGYFKAGRLLREITRAEAQQIKALSAFQKVP